MTFNLKQLEQYPLEPGVYLMKNEKGDVLYVGKAKQLKNRLKQYFLKSDTRPMIPFLLSELTHIDTLVVPTEKEALILENTLIKKHAPKYNALLKDDKTFISLMINNTHPWPMLRLTRYKGKPKEKGLYFGPYTSAYAARQTFELMTRLFPLRQCSNEEFKRRTRPCLLYGIKRCIAPCVNKCTKEEYQTFVEGAIRFLRGQDKEIVKNLYEQMQKASDSLEFEQADAYLHSIRQIEHVTEKRGIVAKTDGNSYDALAIYRQGDEVILMQLFMREGKLVGSEHYAFHRVLESDEELLRSFLLQHYTEKNFLPPEILLPMNIPESDLLEEILHSVHAKKITLATPHKGEKKALVALAYKNARATFEQEKNDLELRERMLLDLQETLKLNRYPKRIECFDTSNISGADLVASMIAFTNGEKDKKRMRLFRIRGIDKGDDYGALHQALSRRLQRAKDEDDLPDLIIVDGGKGQLSTALDVLKELDIASVDAIALAKQEARHDKGITREKIFLPHHNDPISLNPHSPLLFLLQKIRDEAHRTAIGFHRKRRQKRVIATQLDDIPGIGPIKRTRLLRHFGSLQRILSATPDALQEVKGITQKDIAALQKIKLS